MKWGSFFYPHTITVKPYREHGGMGPRYDSPTDLSAEVKDEQKLVRGKDGDEVMSSTQVTVPLSADVTLGSLVTVWPGTAAQRESTVLSIARADNGGPLDSHLVLSLE